jgi:antitoxin component YwqK of YwqJK toxin-antitoxin module
MTENVVLETMSNLRYMDVNIISIVKSYIYENKTTLRKVYVGLDEKRKIITSKYKTRYGVIEGPYIEYENNNLVETCKYINGKLQGKKEIFYLSGKVCSEENYKEGKRHGIFKEYDEQGNLIRKDEYDNGVIVGESLWFYPTGIIRERITYKEGEVKERKIHWENGQLNKICNSFKLHGEKLEWYDNGNIMSITLYNKGEIIDEKRFHKNGNPMEKVGNVMWM